MSNPNTKLAEMTEQEKVRSELAQTISALEAEKRCNLTLHDEVKSLRFSLESETSLKNSLVDHSKQLEANLADAKNQLTLLLGDVGNFLRMIGPLQDDQGFRSIGLLTTYEVSRIWDQAKTRSVQRPQGFTPNPNTTTQS